MDGKSLLIRLTIIMAIVVGWMYVVNYETAKHPEWSQQSQTNQSGGNPSTNPTTSTSTTNPGTIEAASQPTTSPTGWRIAVEGAAGSYTIGSTTPNDPTFNVGMVCNSRGASIDLVTLTPFRETVNSPDPYTFQKPYSEGDDDSLKQSMAAATVTIDGQVVSLWDKDWQLKASNSTSATYEIKLRNTAGEWLGIDKTYTVSSAQSGGDTPQGYEVSVVYSIENSAHSASLHNISLDFNGPTTPQAETLRQATEIVSGYDAGGDVIFDHHPVTDFKAGTNRDFVPNDRNLPLLWLGASSNYFDAIVRFPLAQDQTVKIIHAMGLPVNPEATTADRLAAIRFSTAGFTLTPGQHLSLPLKVFFGPKSRAVLKSPYYASFPNNYDETLIMVSGACSICTFIWLINILVGLLGFLHMILRDWGLSIIALVCIVRVLLHPITKRSQGSMMKMQKLSPEIERLKKKFGDDKEGFTKAQMELYKSVGFTPVLGCLPMFLQMPIFIALWRALQTTFELRQAPFHFTWIHDLSQPDGLIKFASPHSFYFITLAGINVLPLAMAVVTFINTKYFMPKPAMATPEQEQQQKMMQVMTLVFPFMFYSFPSGLNLYYLTTTTLGIFESKIIRNHIKQQEEREKNAGPIIVDAPVVKKGPPAPPKKKGFLQRMQERAEQMARDAERAKKRR